MTPRFASVFQRHRLCRFGWFLLLLGGLALSGCYIDSPEDDATAKDVKDKSFVFASGRVFHAALTGETTLAFGSEATTFTLTSAGKAAEGTSRFGSCILTVTKSAYMEASAGPIVNDVITLDPCEFDSSDNTLSVGRGSIMATSKPSSASDGTGTGTTGNQATLDNLRSRQFTFPNGDVFDSALFNIQTDLTFGADATTFRLSSTNNTTSGIADGNHRLSSGSCLLTVTSSTYAVGAGPQASTTSITLTSCTFNSTNTTLTVTNNGVTRTSTAAVAVQ